MINPEVNLYKSLVKDKEFFSTCTILANKFFGAYHDAIYAVPNDFYGWTKSRIQIVDSFINLYMQVVKSTYMMSALIIGSDYTCTYSKFLSVGNNINRIIFTKGKMKKMFTTVYKDTEERWDCANFQALTYRKALEEEEEKKYEEINLEELFPMFEKEEEKAELE